MIHVLILCIEIALFYNSLRICGKPLRSNYIHLISGDKYNLILIMIWRKIWYSSEREEGSIETHMFIIGGIKMN